MLSQDGYTVQYGYTEGAEGQPGNWYVEVITPEGATLDRVHHDGRAAYAAARRLAARHGLTPVKVSGKGKRGETAPAPALTFGEALPEGDAPNDASDGKGGNDATSNPAPEGHQIPLPFGIVMWAAGQVCRRPTSTRPRRAEVYYPVTCPSCGAVRSLRGCDARKAERNGGQCAHCQRRAAGRKGAAMLAALSGQGVIHV